jgi:hypothetical protein
VKVLKISEEVHEKLKEHLKESGVFMQSYVEYFINKAIEKGIVYAMKDKIDDFKNYIYPQELDLKKGKRTLIKNVLIKKKNPHSFYIQPKDPFAFDEYLKNLTQYTNINEDSLNALYFNLPGYHNVTHPKIEPEDKQGVIKFVTRSRSTGFPMFILLKNIPEKLEEQLNKAIDGEFQLRADCTIEDAPNPYNTLEDHIKNSFGSMNFKEDGFYDETGIKFVSEKIELPKIQEFDLKEFKTDLIGYIMENSTSCDESSVLKKVTFEESPSGARKIFSKIMSLSHIISTKSRFGPATHCVVPSYLTKYLEMANDMSLTVKAYNEKHFDENDHKIMNPIGSYAGMIFFESDLVKDIHVYRTCEHTLKMCYNFDKCDVDEINSLFVNDSEHAIYKLKVLREFDSQVINSWMEHNLKSYPFIEIDGSYSPYSLDINTTSFDYSKEKEPGRKEFHQMTGLDYDAQAESILTREVFQTLLKDIITPNSDKTHEMKIYGNEEFPELVELIDDTLKEYARTESTPIVTNGRVASFLSDFSGYVPSPIKNYDGLLYHAGDYKGRAIYVDPFMKYNDDRILFMNDIQLKHGKEGILISAYKNDDIIELTKGYKILKDIVVVKVVDNENRMM